MGWDPVDERQEEKTEDKWRQDPLNTIFGALILIWAGVVLLAANLDMLDVFTQLLDRLPLPLYELPFAIPFFGANAWRLFFLGAGVIVLCEVIVRLIVPRFRRKVFGSLIAAIVLIALGLGNFEVIWPLILIAIGISVLLGGLVTRRKT